MRMLVRAHANVKARDRQGNTPLLHAAASAVFLEPEKQVIGMLLENGADARDSNSEGVTALMLVARKGAREAAATLLRAGASVKAADRNGSTALIGAANQGDTELVELLLDAGADVKARDRQGMTALLAAIDAPDHFGYQEQFAYSFEIARSLIDRGADVNARNSRGDTPLRAALRRGHQDIAAVLRQAGAKD
jgi:serine/threonine-protein phosphatase 6 regulatory ankyrin repeat subunit B